MNCFSYHVPCGVKSVCWSRRCDYPFRLAVSTRDIVHDADVEVFGLDQEYRASTSMNHSASVKSLCFFPNEASHHPDLLATGSDSLSIWRLSTEGTYRISHLSPSPYMRYTTVSSLDWNASALQRIATVKSSRTCTVWDIQKGVAEAEYENEDDSILLRDISLGDGYVLAACYTNVSVKQMDLRTGKIDFLFKAQDSVGAIEWSPVNDRYLALARGCSTEILDTRKGKVLNVSENFGHDQKVTSMAWDPICDGRILSTAKDWRIALWDFHKRYFRRHMTSVGPIHEGKWSILHPRWMALAYSNELQVVEVLKFNGEPAF